MIKKLVLIFSLFVLFSNCNKEDETSCPDEGSVFNLKEADSLDLMDYEIYSLVINNRNQIMVINQRSKQLSGSKLEDFDDFLVEYPDVEPEIINDLISVNSTPAFFGADLISDNEEIQLISQEEIDYIFDECRIDDSWNLFAERYQNADAFFRLSRIGYNNAKDEAIVEISDFTKGNQAFAYSCTSLTYLTKENGVWIIKSRGFGICT